MNLAQMLEAEEGRVAYAYPDSLGYLTIGIGRLIDKRKGGRLTDREIDYLLANDIAEKTAEVLKSLPWIMQLDEARRAVLLGMAFQMGTAGLLGFKNTLELVRTGNYRAAGRGMMQSRWAEQTPKRAQRMAQQMETGLWVLA
jgi:lysozyme